MVRQSNADVTDMPKAVIYARYSSHSQTEQSIEGQMRINYEYAKREGFVVIGEYVDRAVSGTSANARPDFQRMITDAAKHGFDYVIVYKLDRFARSRYDSAVYKHKLRAFGVKVLSATENISDNPEGIILEAVLEASAEYYSRELSQKIKRGLHENTLKGNYLGGPLPLGYKAIDKKVIIDDESSEVVKYIFEEYAKGNSKKEIMQRLSEKGIKNSKGKQLSSNSFQTVLRNKKYIGIFSYNGCDYENIYPAIINKELFEKVQQKLDAVARMPGANKAYQDYLLQGKIFCGYCGGQMAGDCGTSKNGSKHFYYSCTAKKKRHTCKKKSEKKDFLERYIVEQTLSHVLTPSAMEEIAKGVVAEYDKEFNNEKLKIIKKKINKLEADADKIFKLILSCENEVLIKRYENQVVELDLQRADLKIDLSKLELASGIRYAEKDIIIWLKQFCKGDIMDEDFRRRIIYVLVNAVYLYDDKVVIYYNTKDSKQVCYIDNCDPLDELCDEGTQGFNEKNSVRISNDMLQHGKLLS